MVNICDFIFTNLLASWLVYNTVARQHLHNYSQLYFHECVKSVKKRAITVLPLIRAPGLETPIVYTLCDAAPDMMKSHLVPVTRKQLNTFCSYLSYNYFTHNIVIINYIASY